MLYITCQQQINLVDFAATTELSRLLDVAALKKGQSNDTITSCGGALIAADAVRLVTKRIVRSM